MNVLKRACLFIIRKRTKSITLLFLLTVICFLATLCILIGNASSSAQASLRQSMGGYFKVQTDYKNGYTQRVTDGMVTELLGIGGIKAFNGVDQVELLTPGLSLIPGRFTAEGDEKAKLARFIGNSSTQLNEYFLLKNFSLVEGRHITAEDKGCILISSSLAQRNALSLGDQIEVTYFDEDAVTKNQPYYLKVVGTYSINASQNAGATNAECDISDNFIFTDTYSIRSIVEEAIDKRVDYYRNEVAFFVEDPAELNKIIEKATSLPGYEWESYLVTANSKAYDKSAKPMERLSAMIKTFIVVIAVISMILLSLVLFLGVRDRIREIGILLSIGQKKHQIVVQLIIENLLVAAVALVIAMSISQLLNYEQISSWASEIAAGDSETEREESIMDQIPGVLATPELQELPKPAKLMKIQLGWMEILEITGIGILIIVISTVVAAWQILKMNPKDILVTMS